MNNLISIFNLHCQLILEKFNLLTLVLVPKGKPNSLKDYNNFNKVDIITKSNPNKVLEKFLNINCLKI